MKSWGYHLPDLLWTAWCEKGSRSFLAFHLPREYLGIPVSVIRGAEGLLSPFSSTDGKQPGSRREARQMITYFRGCSACYNYLPENLGRCCVTQHCCRYVYSSSYQVAESGNLPHIPRQTCCFSRLLTQN